MKFCTTCGRTYEDPAVTACPHDGTPLFGMAGEEPEPEEASIAELDSPASEAELAEQAFSLNTPSIMGEEGFGEGDFESALAESGFEDEASKPEQEEVDLFGSSAEESEVSQPEDPLSAGSDELDSPGFDPPEDDFMLEPSAPESSSEAEDDLFGEPDEDELFGESSGAEEDEEQDALAGPLDEEPLGEPSEPQDVIGDALADEDSDELEEHAAAVVTGPALDNALFDDLPAADEAASIQIDDAIDTAMDDLGLEDGNMNEASTALDFEPDLPDADDELPPIDPPSFTQEKKSNAGLLVGVLVVLVIAGAIYYFTLGPGAQAPNPPENNVTTPTVTTPPQESTPAATTVPVNNTTTTTPEGVTGATANGTTANGTTEPAETTPEVIGTPPPALDPVKKPVEKKPVEKKPVEKKPVEKKPVEKKPAEKKPAEKKPEEKPKASEELSNELDGLLGK